MTAIRQRHHRVGDTRPADAPALSGLSPSPWPRGGGYV